MSAKIIFALIFGFLSWANADVNVNSSVDRNKMGEGDTFTLTVSISSDSSVSAQPPQLPELQGFDIINTWTGSESRSTFVNGQFKVERKKTYNYMLAPQKVGKFKIDPIVVNIEDNAYSTKPIDIEVVAGNVAPPPNRRRQPSPLDQADQLFSQLLRNRPRPGFKSEPVEPNEAFFIQVEVDKTDVFEGEQITASFYLYTRAHINDIDTLKYPTLSGFWKEDIEVATRLGFAEEVINGIVYRKARLASYALFPIKPGKIVVDSYRARCTVVSPNAFGFGRPSVITKESKEVEIDVRPLPANTSGLAFAGGVGDFKLNSSLDAKEVPLNQPITWKLVFSGKGNAKLIDLPKMELPEGLELYDTKKEAVFNKNGIGTKTFELLVIPRKEGTFSLPALNLALFNPDTKSYYSVSSPAADIQVQPGSGEQVMDAIPLAEKKIDEVVKDKYPDIILAPKTSWLNLSHTQIFSLWGVGYILAFLLLGWQGAKELGGRQRKKDIEEVLNMKFKIVHKHADSGEWRRAGIHVMNTFYYLIGEIAGEGGASEEVEKLFLKVPPSVRREVGDELLKCLKKFEILSFAPEGVVGSLKEKNNLKNNIQEMEKVLFKAVKLGLGKQVDETK